MFVYRRLYANHILLLFYTLLLSLFSIYVTISPCRFDKKATEKKNEILVFSSPSFVIWRVKWITALGSRIHSLYEHIEKEREISLSLSSSHDSRKIYITKSNVKNTVWCLYCVYAMSVCGGCVTERNVYVRAFSCVHNVWCVIFLSLYFNASGVCVVYKTIAVLYHCYRTSKYIHLLIRFHSLFSTLRKIQHCAALRATSQPNLCAAHQATSSCIFHCECNK